MERRVPSSAQEALQYCRQCRSPVPGEVIIVHDENHPRSFWRLGRVTDIIKGDDGQVCGAVIDVVTNGKP